MLFSCALPLFIILMVLSPVLNISQVINAFNFLQHKGHIPMIKVKVKFSPLQALEALRVVRG
jgi:hypothetical protein